ncbi:MULTISPECIES: hypothetical protein [Xanthobacter]|uniref:hypothetical protein n=1 Tax=Xanthobacter TaxID=279 RepID=UPI00145D48C3|nr:hypothetical protein [Xanthobacter sp. SG618]NMN60636.1 hypothetical protein [Xanthobacter sp. SG618]
MQLYRFPPFARSVAAGAALAIMTSGAAWARPDSLTMTCAAAARMVASNGAVVIGTGPNIFDRYVNSLRYCSGFEQLKPEWIKTKDNPQCFVGYTCYVPTRENSFR